MSPAGLESLNEGAWFSGKDAVDAAVRALNPTAAARGALRVLVRGKRWAEVTQQLDLLEHKAAVKYVRGLADRGSITGGELRLLMRTTGNLRLLPGETVTVGEVLYAVYAGSVRFGGDPVWRYNNPGALKRPSPEVPSWGYIGNDPKWFLIFPDMATGQRAAVGNLAHQAKAYGDRSIIETMESYAILPATGRTCTPTRSSKRSAARPSPATPSSAASAPPSSTGSRTPFSAPRRARPARKSPTTPPRSRKKSGTGCASSPARTPTGQDRPRQPGPGPVQRRLRGAVRRPSQRAEAAGRSAARAAPGQSAAEVAPLLIRSFRLSQRLGSRWPALAARMKARTAAGLVRITASGSSLSRTRMPSAAAASSTQLAPTSVLWLDLRHLRSGMTTLLK